MITERDIAEKFSVIWKQHFPMLTANFMRVFNESQIERINEYELVMTEAIRFDLIAEFAFNLAGEVMTKSSNMQDILANQHEVERILLQTAFEIWRPQEYSKEDLNLTESELEAIALICSNIIAFTGLQKMGYEYKPHLKGYGIIPDLIADISIDDTLYEVKTVNRNFRSSDLKQLFIYLALQQVTGTVKWKYAGLYNPRRGVYCKFNIRNLIYDLSGGKSYVEVFRNLLDNITRDVRIDSRF